MLTVARTQRKLPAFHTTRRLEQSQHPYPKPDVSNTHTRYFHKAHVHVTIPLPTSSSSRVLHFAFHSQCVPYILPPFMYATFPAPLSTSVPGQQSRRSSIHTSVHSLVTSPFHKQTPPSAPTINNLPLSQLATSQPHSSTQLYCCNALRPLFQLPTYRNAPLRIPTSTPVL